ncbi:MAG TPA: hypothetical protein VIT88_05260 [Pyrinomonadaceae bacterium]
MKRILLIAILVLAPGVVPAQKPNALPLGWDLTYKTVLESNHVAPNEWIWKWLEPGYQSPAKQLIATWKHEPIESSVLVDWPAPHAGEHITMWFVRTQNAAYYFEEVEKNPPHKTQESLNPQSFDKFLGVVSPWKQGNPVKPEDVPHGGIPGYYGFLSLYERGKSRQMLLTLEDYVVCATKQCETWKPGRLSNALMLIPRFKVK